MKKLAAQILLAGAAVASAGMFFVEASQKLAVEPAKTQAKKAFDGINQAYEKGDIDTMMSNIASDASLTIIGAEDGNYYVGYENVKNGLKKAAQLRAYKCQMTEQSVNVNKSSDVAWIAQKSDCTMAKSGKKVTMRSTAVEIKKDGKWLLIQAHHSLGTPEE
ncbi:nuclear transport factor 2 family protein [Candidatus Magnetominusculus dajiuhuensis]|uniref:nuclear transport factor 2 family protein n=1 Tax=Candidatus Magnetominusculus dajiuhuensis TaxID=3137712 RepID=UPI003B42AAEE